MWKRTGCTWKKDTAWIAELAELAVLAESGAFSIPPAKV
jgi:hypothetical protein